MQERLKGPLSPLQATFIHSFIHSFREGEKKRENVSREGQRERENPKQSPRSLWFPTGAKSQDPEITI